MTRALPHHAEAACDVDAAASDVFLYVDRPEHVAGHMARRSWRMGGATMGIETDQDGGRAVGSQIRLTARVLGMALHVDCVVRERNPPRSKAWETIGEPRLLVIGPYRITVSIDALAMGGDRNSPTEDRSSGREGRDPGSRVRITIDYALPAEGTSRALGILFGRTYARWCVDQMSGDLRRHFAERAPRASAEPAASASSPKGNVK